MEWFRCDEATLAMAVNSYLVQPHSQAQGDDEARMEIAELINSVGGFILMTTSTGSLIAAFDEQFVSLIQAHRAVDFCGGVTLDLKGAAAERLRLMFARNVAAQIGQRSEAGASPGYPAGYRPLRWHERYV